MAYRIFISSVQREFAKERKALAEYIRKDAILGKFFAAHKSVPVNPLLARAMYLRGYIERVGSGTGDIIERCREKGLPPPIWENEDDGLTIVLRRAAVASQPEGNQPMSPQTPPKTGREIGGETNRETVPNRQPVGLDVGLDVGLEHNVIGEIQAQSQVRMSEIAVRYHVSKRTVERVFSKLSREGRIARIGGKRFGHWEVIG